MLAHLHEMIGDATPGEEERQQDRKYANRTCSDTNSPGNDAHD
jgi:hypothetical protein